MIALSLKIEIMSNWLQSDESRIKFTNFVWMIADLNFYDVFFTFLSYDFGYRFAYGFGYSLQPKAEVFHSQAFDYGLRWKLCLPSNT